VPASDDLTNAIAALGSGGFLFVVARWLWHYEQVVTDWYEVKLQASHKDNDLLKLKLEAEIDLRHAAEEEAARLRLLVLGGIDHHPEV